MDSGVRDWIGRIVIGKKGDGKGGKEVGKGEEGYVGAGREEEKGGGEEGGERKGGEEGGKEKGGGGRIWIDSQWFDLSHP